MKKRILAIILAMITALSFVACSDDDDSDRSSRKKKDDTSASNSPGSESFNPFDKESGADDNIADDDEPGIIEDSFVTPRDDEDSTGDKIDIDLEVPEYGKVKIKSYSIVDGYNDEKYIVLTMDYTNLYENQDLTYSNFEDRLHIYQDNARLSPIAHSSDKDRYTAIRTNASIEVAATYILRNTTSDVEFECGINREVTGTGSITIK